MSRPSSAPNYYALLELPNGKGLAAKPYGKEGFYFRLMENGRGVGDRYRVGPHEFRFHVTAFIFTRRDLEISGIGAHTIKFQGQHWATVRGSDWSELFSLAKRIREGATTYDMTVYRRNHVLMKEVVTRRSELGP